MDTSFETSFRPTPYFDLPSHGYLIVGGVTGAQRSACKKSIRARTRWRENGNPDECSGGGKLALHRTHDQGPRLSYNHAPAQWQGADSRRAEYYRLRLEQCGTVRSRDEDMDSNRESHCRTVPSHGDAPSLTQGAGYGRE